ncbi:hypothetical protein FQN54_001520 [Arachnomyces sp. PD_36]|nr:hypothetical protein FQN54_001520 [Arachnomyces sp. PD_36]
MSGVEAAGLVLGAIPLIVVCLKTYIQGVATVKRYFKYKNELKSLLRALTTEYDIFRNNCEELLEGLVQIRTMALLLQDPGGDRWKDAMLEEKLRNRLRGAYTGYLETVDDMNSVVEEFKGRLKLRDGKVRCASTAAPHVSETKLRLTLMIRTQVQFEDINTFKQEYKRLKFSLSKSTYEDLMVRIRRDNQTLNQLTKQSLSLEVSRARRYHRLPDFKCVRDCATSVYTTLHSSWACDCQVSHTTSLRLEFRTENAESDTDNDEGTFSQPCFRIVFSCNHGNSPASTPTPWSWEEADIRLLRERRDQTISNRLPLAAASKTKSVRFQDEVKVAVSKALDKQPDLGPINSLCRTIQKLQQSQREQCLGFLIDEITRQKHGIFLPKKPFIDKEKWSIVSLQDLIPQQPSIQRRFTRGDKLRLAVILASSVLQLHETPWMEESWRKEDIKFIHTTDGPLYGQPVVARSFSVKRTPKRQNIRDPGTYCAIRNPTLFALGVLLIELCLGKPIEELKRPDEKVSGGISNPALDWVAADRLVEDVYDEGGSRYGDAVRRCIRCDFDQRGTSLEDEGFQRAVYEGVVLLLEDDLKQFHSL